MSKRKEVMPLVVLNKLINVIFENKVMKLLRATCYMGSEARATCIKATSLLVSLAC